MIQFSIEIEDDLDEEADPDQNSPKIPRFSLLRSLRSLLDLCLSPVGEESNRFSAECDAKTLRRVSVAVISTLSIC